MEFTIRQENTGNVRNTGNRKSTGNSYGQRTQASRPGSSGSRGTSSHTSAASNTVRSTRNGSANPNHSAGNQARPTVRSGNSQSRSTYAAAHATAVRRKPAKRRKRTSPFLITLIVILVIAIAGLAGVGIYSMRYADYDKILPNVYVAGVDVGGMTKEEATAAIEASVQNTDQQSLNVILPDQTLSFTPEQGTVLIDVDEAVSEAYNYGRNSTNPFAMARAIKAAKSRRNDIDISTAVTVDTDYIQSLINEKAQEVDSQVIQSDVAVDTDNHTITVTIGTPGYTLDTATLYTLVCNAFASGDYSDINFEYDVTNPDTVVLDRLYEQMTVEAKDAGYDSSTGSITAETVGYSPNTDLDTANQELASAAPGDVLTFDFSIVEPEVSADELNSVLFRDTLYSYGTVYANNENRTTNLRLACEAIDGTVIQPGEVFSFNDTVGERTADKGYQSAVVYVNGNSEPALGGGICQVASTIYYCCLYADLEIVQREEHMYFVTYVPGGMDATVYWGAVDFQFRNSTDYPLRIDANVSNGQVNIALVGTDVDHNTVQIDNKCISETPYQTVNKSGTGEDVSGYTGYVYEITRYVYDSSGNLIRTDTTADLDAMGGGCGTSTYDERDKIVYGGSSSSSSSSSSTTTPSAEPTTETTTETTTEPSAAPSSEPAAEQTTAPDEPDIEQIEEMQ